MVEIQFFYDKNSLQIMAVYVNVKTGSSVFKDADVYAEVNVEDPPYRVTRDHKVVLDPSGEITGTVASVNPVQPSPTLKEWPNPFHGRVVGGDPAAVKPLHVERDIEGQTRDYWCYVTEDVRDLYAAGRLSVGDVVIVIFVDHDLDKPLATQKVYRSW